VGWYVTTSLGGSKNDPLITFPALSMQVYLTCVFALIGDLKERVSSAVSKLKALTPELDVWKPI
jgi:hypothetical protein